MNVNQILVQLRSEREQLNQAILALERLAARGRKPETARVDAVQADPPTPSALSANDSESVN